MDTGTVNVLKIESRHSNNRRGARGSIQILNSLSLKGF